MGRPPRRGGEPDPGKPEGRPRLWLGGLAGWPHPASVGLGGWGRGAGPDGGDESPRPRWEERSPSPVRGRPQRRSPARPRGPGPTAAQSGNRRGQAPSTAPEPTPRPTAPTPPQPGTKQTVLVKACFSAQGAWGPPTSVSGFPDRQGSIPLAGNLHWEKTRGLWVGKSRARENKQRPKRHKPPTTTDPQKNPLPLGSPPLSPKGGGKSFSGGENGHRIEATSGPLFPTTPNLGNTLSAGSECGELGTIPESICPVRIGKPRTNPVRGTFSWTRGPGVGGGKR